MYLLACGQGSTLVLHVNLVLLTCALEHPSSLRLTCSSTPKASSSLQSLLRVSMTLVLCLSWHLHVPYNKVSPPETPFLADVRSSEQEHVLLIVTSSGPGMWWVLGWMEAWAGGSKHGFPSCIWSQAASAPRTAPSQFKPISWGLEWIMPLVRELIKGGSAGWAS